MKIYRNELKYFNNMTTKVSDASKRNCVIMGRKTYFGIPENKRPLPKRLNIVLTNTSTANDYPPDVILCKTLSEALTKLSETELSEDIETIWIVGGYGVYKEAMFTEGCNRIYLTEIRAKFECDAFFPEIPDNFKLVPIDADLSSEVQQENGIEYQYKLYENSN